MGSALKEMMPQPSSRIAITTTRKRLFSAKSTKPRIIERSLLLCVLQDEGVLHHALARLNASADLLQIAGEHVSAGYLHPPELPVARRHVQPVAVMQVKHGRRGNHRVHLALLPVESRFDKHPQAHEARVPHLQANFG